ncbi:hypothetical protein [Prescottella subtropica]|uniref:hypothetical protein n=1 Tax=Prescottella subtropica TaxID=2545757 RepID=UPI0010F8E045|nr:hypothetical protein [Prescottella subtropica]
MTARDWLAAAHTDLAGADDRVAVSEARIAALLTTALDPVDLPEQWAIDRGLLPQPVAAKLARRETEGLPVPLHAHDARTIAAYTAAEWEEIRSRYLTSTRLHRFLEDTRPAPAESSPADTLAGSVTERQLGELRARLPHTEPAAPTTTRPGSVVAGKILDTAYLGGSVGTAGTVFLLLAVAMTVIQILRIRAGIYTGGVDSYTVMIAGTGLLGGLFKVADHRGQYRAAVELTGDDWHALEAATVAGPGPEPGTPEHQLATIAVVLSAQITGCPAWSSDTLAAHRIQLDPAAEAAQITVHAAEISRVRVTLGPDPVGDSDAAARAREQRDGNQQILDAVLASLVRRVAALYRYAGELHALNADYLALESVERSLVANGQLETLIRQTGGDELAARHLDRLTADARDLHTAITARLHILTGDLTALHELPAGTDNHRA